MQYCSNAIFRAVEYKYKNWLHQNLKNANDNFVQKRNIKNRRTESSKQTEINIMNQSNGNSINSKYILFKEGAFSKSCQISKTEFLRKEWMAFS